MQIEPQVFEKFSEFLRALFWANLRYHYTTARGLLRQATFVGVAALFFIRVLPMLPGITGGTIAAGVLAVVAIEVVDLALQLLIYFSFRGVTPNSQSMLKTLATIWLINVAGLAAKLWLAFTIAGIGATSLWNMVLAMVVWVLFVSLFDKVYPWPRPQFKIGDKLI